MGFWFRRRRRGFFDLLDDLFREFEEEVRALEEEIEELIKKRGEVTGPYVYGVRITVGPDGVPKIEEFGNVKPGRRGRPEIRDEMEPLVDVIEHEDEVWVIADIPGVSKDKIKVKVAENRLVIKAENSKKYYKEVSLPAKVKPETAKASYKNGVLEVKIKKSSEELEEGFEVKVE